MQCVDGPLAPLSANGTSSTSPEPAAFPALPGGAADPWDGCAARVVATFRMGDAAQQGPFVVALVTTDVRAVG